MQLPLNTNKTNDKIFHSNRNWNNIDHVCVKINGRAIERVKSTKFFGIHIDGFMNWWKKFPNMLFFKLRHFLPFKAIVTLYRSLFEPHLNYCNVTWCNTCWSYPMKGQILQKKVIRAISWSKINAPMAQRLFMRLWSSTLFFCSSNQSNRLMFF